MPDPANENTFVTTEPSAEIGTLEKDWWQSTTIRAALLAMIPPVAHLLGLDYALIAPYAGDIVTVAFAGLAIVGRLTAKTTIKRG
jgi:hypothetical protein